MDNSFLHSKKLLLVDDEQELLKMVSDILKDAGFETVLTAMTVKEAIPETLSSPPMRRAIFLYPKGGHGR